MTPSKVSPAEWATMNQGGTPPASSAASIEPAEVPTITSALAGSQPVSSATASSAPTSQAPPWTPPAPRTSPTFIAGTLTAAAAAVREVVDRLGPCPAQAASTVARLGFASLRLA